jgi:putative transposase
MTANKLVQRRPRCESLMYLSVLRASPLNSAVSPPSFGIREAARIHERIKNRRRNFIQQQVAWLIKRFGLIAVEALVVRNMVKNPRLAKSIDDAAWSMFFTHLILKAEEAARCVVKVPPAYRSQTCSVCGYHQNIPLSVRVYDCEACETVLHRDHNASRTILGLGRQARVIPEASAL